MTLFRKIEQPTLLMYSTCQQYLTLFFEPESGVTMVINIFDNCGL